MTYIQPNISRNTGIKIITEAIENSQPFLFTRFGDGEMWMLREEHTSSNLNRIKKALSLSESNYQRIMKRMRAELIDCWNDSDLVGIMGDNMKDYGVSYEYDPHKWSVTYEEAKKIGISNSSIGDHMLCRGKELGDPNNFKKIIKGKSIHVLSQNYSQLQKNNLADILGCKITYTEITRTPNNVVHNQNQLLKELDKIKEDIVIYGLGAGGKYVGRYLKNVCGKTCLDFGATLDGWGGIISRPWFNNTQNYLLIK